MKFRWLCSLCLMTNLALAQDYAILERFIALTWQPHEVSCVWRPIFGDATLLSKLTNIEPVGEIENCAHGLLTITVAGEDFTGTLQRVTFKGKARIFGQAFSVCERVKVGDEIKSGMLTPLTCEWSSLRSSALLDPDAITGKLAVRPLIPGRAVLANDVRPLPVIRSGDFVVVFYEQGGVRVKIEGIAMKEGGVGETIPVRVPEVEMNRLEGVIQNDATLRWIH